MDKKDSEEYKKYVLASIDKSFNTVIIGALSAIENEIGKNEKFNKLRQKILDAGHEQRRRAVRLLEKSGIFKSQYSIIFDLRGKSEHDKDNG